MQQPMVVLDAECADDEVCSLANRNAQISQRAVIPSDSRREVGPKSGTMTYWRNPRSTRAAWASSRAPWRTSSRMRSPTRSGSCAAAASSFAVAWVWRPRKCAIQTDVSTRIMACQGCDPHASRPTRLPSPIPWAPPTLRPACVSEPATEGLLPPLLFGRKAGRRHGLRHQFVIDFDGGPHRASLVAARRVPQWRAALYRSGPKPECSQLSSKL